MNKILIVIAAALLLASLADVAEARGRGRGGARGQASRRSAPFRGHRPSYDPRQRFGRGAYVGYGSRYGALGRYRPRDYRIPQSRFTPGPRLPVPSPGPR